LSVMGSQAHNKLDEEYKEKEDEYSRTILEVE
jgi:hypothetical protein